jgi:hypothetical protein
MKQLLFLLIIFLFCLSFLSLAQIIPDFKVNENVGQNGIINRSGSVFTDPDGSVVITWTDLRNGKEELYGQHFDSDGSKLGPNFRFDFDHENDPVGIAMDSTGNFILTWYDWENILAQRFTNTGAALDSNFILNEDSNITMMGHIWPAICTNNTGDFVIVWMDYRDRISNIYAQQYNNDGTALGSNFKVDDDSLTSWKFGIGNLYQRNIKEHI